MDYRIDYQDDGKPISVLSLPSRSAALAKARRLTTGSDRTVYVIGRDSTGDVGQLVYAAGAQIDRDGGAI